MRQWWKVAYDTVLVIGMLSGMLTMMVALAAFGAWLLWALSDLVRWGMANG